MLRQRVRTSTRRLVAMLQAADQRDGKMHPADPWSYCTTSFDPMRAVDFDFDFDFDFADSRGGHVPSTDGA